MAINKKDKKIEVQQNTKNPKHIRSFWPLVLIAVIASALGGAVLSFAYNNVIQDEVFSSTIIPGGIKKFVAKTNTPTTKIAPHPTTK